VARGPGTGPLDGGGGKRRGGAASTRAVAANLERIFPSLHGDCASKAPCGVAARGWGARVIPPRERERERDRDAVSS
jgi:hypothetical protein